MLQAHLVGSKKKRGFETEIISDNSMAEMGKGGRKLAHFVKKVEVGWHDGQTPLLIVEIFLVILSHPLNVR
jgi:hypothetical protein